MVHMYFYVKCSHLIMRLPLGRMKGQLLTAASRKGCTLSAFASSPPPPSSKSLQWTHWPFLGSFRVLSRDPLSLFPFSFPSFSHSTNLLWSLFWPTQGKMPSPLPQGLASSEGAVPQQATPLTASGHGSILVCSQGIKFKDAFWLEDSRRSSQRPAAKDTHSYLRGL